MTKGRQGRERKVGKRKEGQLVECPNGWFRVALVRKEPEYVVVKWRRWFSDDAFKYLRMPTGMSRAWYFLKLAQEASEVKRPSLGDKRGPTGSVQEDSKFRLDYPALWKFLAEETYEDGDKRERGSLRLSWEPTRGWTAYLRDPTATAIAFRNAVDLETLLMEVDSFLSDPAADWEVDKYATPKKPKPGKK